ncbi:hypothetical protein BZG36_00114 [Bifiguratus adelaidae]|uniref:Uncharacterized protein n=1 Tax=Bifiguratus adelaidae TaxID=1938954 RepID=A0A261Y8J0_9FUNG|nr:hypothetical protein BZG36_00114 [Bifiguratus adelaidae]
MADRPTFEALPVRTYEFGDPRVKSLELREDPTGQWAGGVGSTVWDAGLVLAKYIERLFGAGPVPLDTTFASTAKTREFRLPEGASVLELGSGTGLVGLVYARLSAGTTTRVRLTDKQLSMPLLQQNISANNVSNAECSMLDWEDTPNGQTYDIILLSDCLWHPPLYDSLIATLQTIAGSNTVILLAYEKRNFQAELEFWRKFSTRFSFTYVTEAELDDTWQSEDIFVFRAWPKGT